MKNQKPIFIALVFALAFALAPVTKAAPAPIRFPPPPTGPDAVESPVVTVHSAGDVNRGKTGSFVVDMRQSTSSENTQIPYYPYVNFSVSGTAIPGVDYIALVSPVQMGPDGYGVILVKTLPDPRGSGNRQSYTVVVTLESGLGYTLGQPMSAKMTIKP